MSFYGQARHAAAPGPLHLHCSSQIPIQLASIFNPGLCSDSISPERPLHSLPSAFPVPTVFRLPPSTQHPLNISVHICLLVCCPPTAIEVPGRLGLLCHCCTPSAKNYAWHIVAACSIFVKWIDPKPLPHFEVLITEVTPLSIPISVLVYLHCCNKIA